MNKRTLVLCSTICGIALGAFFVRSLGQSSDKKTNLNLNAKGEASTIVPERTASKRDKELELGRIYTGVLAHRVSIDVRVLMLLNTNDTEAAKSLLFVDLKGRVAELSELQDELGLHEVDSNILYVAQEFLRRPK